MQLLAARNKARDIRLLGFGLVTLSAFSASRWETSTLVSSIMPATGAALVAPAINLRAWAVLYIAGYKTQRLIVEGPFSICRNPIYLSTLMGAFGIALCTATATFPLLVLLLFVPYLMLQIRDEEAKLAGLHAEQFVAYAARTPRLLPNLALYHEPVEYVVRPAAFRRWMLDVLWLVAGLGSVELLELMRRSGLVPVLVQFV